jgi:tetratricopeptide (TPR) repeat protein
MTAETSPDDLPPRTSALLVAVIAAAALVACHLPALHCGYFFDDLSEIRDNPAIRTLLPPTRPMFEGGELPHRPIPYLSFAVSHALGESLRRLVGTDLAVGPAGFRLANLAIHLVNGWLCYRILRVICPAAAVPAAALWLLHPLQTQPVVYAYQRIELLVSCFGLAMFAAFLQAAGSPRPGRWLALSAGFCGLAMASKESAAAFPLVVLLYDWLMEAGSLREVARRRGWYSLALAATYGVLAAVLVMERQRYPEFASTSDAAAPLVRSIIYAVNQAAVVAWYLSLVVWPVGQSLDHGTVLRHDLFGADAWLFLPVTAVVVAIGWAVQARRRRPLAAFSLLAFLTLLAPTSSLLPVHDVCVEHRMYLPSLIPVTAVVAWIASLVPRTAFRIVMVVIAGLLCGLTAARLTVYTSPLAVWEDAVRKSPGSTRALSRLGTEYSLLDRHDEAISVCLRAVERDPKNAVVRAALAATLMNAGRLPEAIATCRAGLELACGWQGGGVPADPVCGRLVAYLGVATAWGGDPLGTAILERVGERFPDVPRYREWLADAVAGSDPQQAAAIYADLVALVPEDPHLRFRLGTLLAASDAAAAERQLRAAVALDPEHADAHNNLAGLLLLGGRRAEAIRHYEACLAIRPDHPQARRMLEQAAAAGRE